MLTAVAYDLARVSRTPKTFFAKMCAYITVRTKSAFLTSPQLAKMSDGNDETVSAIATAACYAVEIIIGKFTGRGVELREIGLCFLFCQLYVVILCQNQKLFDCFGSSRLCNHL